MSASVSTRTRTAARTPAVGHTDDAARSPALVTITAVGLGPLARSVPADRSAAFAAFRSSFEGRLLALDSAGRIGRQLIELTLAFGGTITSEQLWSQLAGADRGQIEAELERLAAADLLRLGPDGSLQAVDALAPYHRPVLRSMNDPQAIGADQLMLISRKLGLNPPGRKGGRIAAIAAHFAHHEARQLVLKELSGPARTLLARILSVAGPAVISPEQIGVSRYCLPQVAPPRYDNSYTSRPLEAELQPLADLAARGIVGVSEWQGALWIWREALPLLDAPLHGNWIPVARPARAPQHPLPGQLPPFVSTVDRALRHWAQVPPSVLKNGELRLAKTVIRSTAKALGCPETAAELAAGLAIDIGLVLPNDMDPPARGRGHPAAQVWLADPSLAAAWSDTSPVERWACLVAAWCRPEGVDDRQQVLCNRHLVLFELAQLEADEGYLGDEAFGRWIGDRYAPLAVEEAVHEILAELRTLGLVPPEGPLALTAVGRQLLDDPTMVHTLVASSETSVLIQADMTVLVPPGLDPELHSRLADLAHRESSGQAELLRLDEERITRAVQAGATAEGIISFLAGVSSVPLTDSVTRLVSDAARRADRVRMATAATVVVTRDPADLTLACAIKAAELVALTDTVATSPLPLDKVRAALDRKGLAPMALAGQTGPVNARSAANDAAWLRRKADQARRSKGGRSNDFSQADYYDELADKLSDPGARLVVTGPLAVTPAVLATLNGGGNHR